MYTARLLSEEGLRRLVAAMTETGLVAPTPTLPPSILLDMRSRDGCYSRGKAHRPTWARKRGTCQHLD